VFDPERDEERGARPFYLRLLVVAAVTAVACAVLWPSVHGFVAGPDHLTNCLAITDGWRADKSAPSAAESRQIQETYPAPLTDAERNDPAAVARFRAQLQIADASPAMQHEIAYEDWRAGTGACVHESRHRLILSGLGLAAIAAVVTGIAVGRWVRLRSRDLPAAFAAGSVEDLA
jgi:hypothetical protein